MCFTFRCSWEMEGIECIWFGTLRSGAGGTVDGLILRWLPMLLLGENRVVSICVSVVDNSSNWAVCGKSSGVISMPVAARATHRVHMEVMPLFAGYLPLPDVRLFKYLPHHSAHSSQLDAGKDSKVGRARCGSGAASVQGGGTLRSQGRACPQPRVFSGSGAEPETGSGLWAVGTYSDAGSPLEGCLI